MRSIGEFIIELEKNDIFLSLKNGKLTIKARENDISDALLNHIKTSKDEIIQFLENDRPFELSDSVEEATYYPTSFAQQQIYAISQFESIGTTYNLYQALRFDQKLSKQELEGYISKIIDTHEALRTTFAIIEEELVQKVHSDVVIHIQEEHIDTNELESKLTHSIRAFDLNTGPLFRVFLFHVPENTSVVLLDTHHIISDGISMDLIKTDLIDLISGKTPKDVRMSYKDFCNWQQNKFNAGSFIKEKNFWKQQLSESKEDLALPYDFNTSQTDNFEGGVHTFFLNLELGHQVKQFCEDKRMSLNMFLLGCYNILLSKLTGTDDVMIGTVTSGRNNPLLSNIVGLFTNILPFRSFPESDKSLLEFFDEIKTSFLQILENDSYPINKLMSELNTQDNHYRHQLFNTVFLYQINDHSSNHNSNASSVDKVPFAVNTSKFDITISAFENNRQIGFRLEYKSKLFKDSTIRKIGDYFENIIKQASVGSDVNISNITLLSKEKQAEINTVLDKSQVGYPKSETICSLFEKQVVKSPNQIAVDFGFGEISYLELDKASNQLANFLVSEGIKPSSVVAVLLGRDINAIIAILAILKVGGVYLPIDLNSSPERLQYILSDSAASTIISDTQTFDSVIGSSEAFQSTSKDLNVIYLDQHESEIQSSLDVHSKIEVAPTDLAYIIYTSGTTGKPKGALIEHKNVVRLLFNDNSLFDFNSSDVWTLFHALNFDFSVWEMYGALLTGGKLILVDEQTVKDTDAFLQLLKDKHVTVLNQTPRAFYSLSEKEATHDDNNVNLRYIIFGGERLMPKKLKTWKDTYPNTKLVNMYGITETTVHVTYKEITLKDIETNQSNIGELLPTLKGYIVDKDYNIVPQGVVGELLVAGEGLARGYLNKPELTAEKFSIEQFGERVYHSGDLVKLDASGDLIYVGRNDKQLKIRGYRVEPKEIEDCILSYKAVTNVVVCLQDTEQNSNSEDQDYQSLCAYFTADQELSNQDLYSFLKPKLPSYYIPSYFIQLNEIPRTANGKTDYKNLPLPITVKEDAVHTTDNEVKRKIIGIFNTLTHTSNFDLDHSFFSIGGDSIKVIRLASMLEKEFKRSFSISDLYVNDTVNKITEFVSTTSDDINVENRNKVHQYIEELKDQTLVELDASNVDDIYPMSDIEAGMSYHYLRYNDQNVYHDCFGFSIKLSDFRPEVFRTSCHLLFEKHDIFRSAFYLDRFSIPLKVVYKDVKLDYEHLDISAYSLDEKKKKIGADMKRDLDTPFQIEERPLIRFFTYELSSKSVYLFFSVHHAILDGWSVNAFLVELFNLYNGLSKGMNQAPKAMKSSYKDAVIHEIVEKNKSSNQTFWKEYLSDHQRLILEQNDIDHDNEYMPIHKHVCDQALFDKVKKYSETQAISLKNLLFGAFSYAIGVIQNQKEFALGIVTNLRPPVEDGDAILGCFLNTVPVKINLNSHKESWQDYISNVNDNLNEIKKFERISLFEISKLTAENSGDKNPFFDVLFNYLDFHINDNLDLDYNELFDYNEIDLDKHTNTNTYLDFEVNVTTNELVLIPKYNRQYFSEEKVAKICSYFVEILSELVDNPTAALVQNKIIPSEERQLVENQFVSGEVAINEFDNILAPFEKSVKLYPNNCAIALKNHEITYQELNANANRLAHVLTSLKQVEDSLIGVMLERTPEMITSVISVLKAGYAYVPIEANQPAERISKIIHNSGVQSLIVSSNLLVKFGAAFTEISTLCNIICVDALPEEIDQISVGDKRIIHQQDIVSASSEDLVLKDKRHKLAYIIYTSGTTGTPKGVVVHHGTVINTLDWINKKYQVNPLDKLLFVNSLAFDLSVYDIFGILWAGGSIRIADAEENKNPDSLIDIILHEGITFWNSAPASLQRLVPGLESLDGESYKSALRLVLLSGDWIPISLPPFLQEKFPLAKVVSLGGATEASIWSNYFNIGDIEPHWKSIPYGKPIQNARYYILDSELNLCPIGTQGDLYIGGQCLAIGYFNDPKLSRQKFISNPYVEGEIIYKTGDLARWFEDGNIEFLGRNDNQVKIRGYRIELGEIENQLNQWEYIKRSVISIYKDNGEQFLCAYYMSDKELDADSIKEYLKDQLPDYMIPTYYFQVDAFHITSNGKLDRKKLPKPSHDDLQRKEYVKPTTEIEKHLCTIYEEFFNIENISTIDNFYDIGGDSLKAINILSIIQKEMNVKIELNIFFQVTTIKELALQVENKIFFSKKPTDVNDSTIFI